MGAAGREMQEKRKKITDFLCAYKKKNYLCPAIPENSTPEAQVVELVDTLL